MIEYFRTDIDNPELDQALMRMFSGRLDLCADFKRLYVYGHMPNSTSLSDEEANYLSEILKNHRQSPISEHLVKSVAELASNGASK